MSAAKHTLHESDKLLCPLCGTENTRLLLRRSAYSLHACGDCRARFKQTPHPGRKRVRGLQDGLYTESYLSNRSGQRGVIRRMSKDRLRLLLQKRRRGNLLEVGCGIGEFLERARKSGFTALGIDTSPTIVRRARALGRAVRLGSMETLELPEAHFDVVCLFHVLEHMDNPGRFLRAARRVLQEHGLLFIITPNLRSLTDWLFGLRHPVYTREDHLLFFSAGSLRRLLRAHGFRTLTTTSKEYPHHIFSSAVGFFGALLKGLTPHRRRPAAVPGSRDDRGTKPAAATAAANDRRDIPSGMPRPGLRGRLKRLIWQLPVIFGTLWYPLTLVYRILAEKAVRGHELIIMAGKTGNGKTDSE